MLVRHCRRAGGAKRAGRVSSGRPCSRRASACPATLPQRDRALQPTNSSTRSHPPGASRSSMSSGGAWKKRSPGAGGSAGASARRRSSSMEKRRLISSPAASKRSSSSRPHPRLPQSSLTSSTGASESPPPPDRLGTKPPRLSKAAEAVACRWAGGEQEGGGHGSHGAVPGERTRQISQEPPGSPHT